MTDTEMSDAVRETLRRIVDQYGAPAYESPRRCEAFLRDLCGEHRREIFVVICALREKVAADLLAAPDHTPRELLMARLATRLQDNLGLAESFAQWAVEAWAVALGVMSESELVGGRTAEIARRLHAVVSYDEGAEEVVTAASGVLGRCEADVRSVAFSPDGRMVAAAGGRGASTDNSIRLWDLHGGRVQLLGTLALPIMSIAFGPDGQWIVSGGRDRRVYIWQLQTGRARAIGVCSDWIHTVAVSPDGRFIAAGGMDRKVYAWNLPSRQERVLGSCDGAVRCLAFSPNSTYLVSGSEDKSIRLWDVETGAVRLVGNCDGAVTSVALSPGGGRVASACESDWLHDNTVCIWALPRGKRRILGNCNSHNVCAVAFSPDQPRIATGGEDRDVRLWNIKDGKVRLLGRCAEAVTSVSFSPDGTAVVSGSRDKTVRLWPVRG